VKFDPNPLFYEMVRLYQRRPADDKILIFNEGGSRSSKTWDFFHFLVFYCDQFRNSGQEIYCHRDTLTNCRDYTLKDFVNCLTEIGVFDHRKLTGVAQKPYYNLFGNHVYFRGLDGENMEAYPSDIAFFNELLEVDSESKIAGIKMRCRKLIVADWNPKYTVHWAFKYEGRPNVYFTRTTFRNNKYCPPAVIKEIMAYEDTEENRKNGTVDKYRWKVYGLGERTAPDGLVFENVTWIDEFPKDIENIYYGSDIGKTNSPSTLIKLGRQGDNIYLKMLAHSPTPAPTNYIDLLREALKADGSPEDSIIWADSAEPGYISDATQARLSVFAVGKFQGSIEYGIALLKKFKIHIVYCPEWYEEQSNYTYLKVHGIQTDEPIDAFNHLWDSSRYAALSNLR